MRVQVTACDVQGCKATNQGGEVIISLPQDLKTAETGPGTATTVLPKGDYCIPHLVEAIQKVASTSTPVYRENPEGGDERLQRGDDGATRAARSET